MTKGTAIHFGAGNIGRGFIGPLLVEAGYHVIFADVNDTLINSLNNRQEYQVHFLEPRKRRPMTVSNYSGILSTNDSLIKAFANDEMRIVTTSVGIAVLPKIAPAIAKGIAARRKAGTKAALNIIACENGIGATEQLKEALLEDLSKEDKQYVEKYIGFANCAVDRIVPPFENQSSPLDQYQIEWSVDRKSLKGIGERETLGIRGMHLTDDLLGFVERKLFTLNCGHAIAAYLGYLKQCDTVFDSIKHKEISQIVEDAMNESSAALVKKHPIFTEKEQREYIEMCLDRFANPNVGDDVQRVGRDPLRKLSQNDRLLGPISMAQEYSLPITNLCYGVAAALLYDYQDDPQAVELQEKVDDLGIVGTITNITDFKQDCNEFKAILTAYHKLQKWRS
ncbi:hypothetical protein Clacol_010618 [Clathrus columnatus]|uniref:Mannitol-1-phosphate 5-dehydrogenase n=1 Tax=Clathrus columnatus TaxID=1419009 RepID=A0AAV5AP78_9AGAM|nr:hypothetical protein Clacol_010618 [Clathrus columnatus]